MNRWRIGTALGCGIIGGAALSLQAPGTAQATVPWQADYTQASAQARREGKPLFVAFRCER